jgi:hypothetical protein
VDKQQQQQQQHRYSSSSSTREGLESEANKGHSNVQASLYMRSLM